ncbi:MAG TPA: hypothetical protein VIY86_10920 [Pirellulaceae bacterium]
MRDVMQGSRQWGSLVLLLSLAATMGCTTNGGPYLGVYSIPILVTPWYQKHYEDKHWEHERYERVPILGPITQGGVPRALDPPSDDQVMRALEKVRPVQGGTPLLWERQRNNVKIAKDLIADYVDPVRVYPLVGPAQQHHAHYKCTVYFSERTYNGWPVPYAMDDREAVEVIYIDHNHLHMVGDVDTGPSSEY